MKKILGALVALMGVALLGWIAYCYLTGQPEVKTHSPFIPLGVSAAFIFVGGKWMGLIGSGK